LATSTAAIDRLPYAVQDQLETNQRAGVLVSFLLGDGWAISGEEDELISIQDRMGGFLRQPE
jgi:hypothetical protein